MSSYFRQLTMDKPNGMICCSIETEPKTLREGLLNQAREVAADVVQNLEPSEASSVFIEGLTRPNIGAKEMKLQTLVEVVEEEEKRIELPLPIPTCKVLVDCNIENAQIIEGPCQCSIASNTSIVIDSPADVIREPLSAPF